VVVKLPTAENKIRTGIILPKELKVKLEREAAEQGRSLNNYMVLILERRGG